MKMKKSIVITFQFSAIHNWPDCPIPEVAYLKNPHRHVFHVTLKKYVTHNDRDIEFIKLKNQITKMLNTCMEGKNLGADSCEDLAEFFQKTYGAWYVLVMEDGENGAELSE